MRVLVAGAAGAVGIPTVRALIAHGHEVIGVTRNPRNRRRLEGLGAVAMIADALDADAIRATVSGAAPDVVIDVLTAGPKVGPTNAADMEPTNLLRTEGTRNLLEASVAAGVRRYVAESHFLVYGTGDLGEAPLTEDAPTPAGAPAQAVRQALDALLVKERTVLEASSAGSVEGIVIRFGSYYGLGAGTEVLAGRTRAQRAGRPGWPIALNPLGGMPWVHVDEAADAIVAALERGRPGAIYNVAEDEAVSMTEFARSLARAVGAPDPWRIPSFIFDWSGMSFAKALYADTRVRLSSERARAELGWAPRFRSPLEGLEPVAEAINATTGSAPPVRTDGEGESAVTVLIALGTNVVMLVAKAFAAALTHSPALFAETLHSLADTGNEVLLYTAVRRARRPADLRHPFGYGAELYYWSLLAALGIFLTGGALSIWEGVQQLIHPGEATNFVFGYAVLGFGFLIDGTSWVTSLRQLRREARARGTRLTHHIRSTTDTTVTAVYMEDGAALLGGSMALVGLAAHQVTRSAIPDALAAIAIGVLLAGIGLRLVQRNRALLTNLSESPRVLDRIRDLLVAHPEVDRVGQVATLYVGPHQLLVIAEVQPADELTGLRVRELVAELRERVTETIPRAVNVYLMPVVAAADEPVLTPFDPDYWLRRYPDLEQA